MNIQLKIRTKTNDIEIVLKLKINKIINNLKKKISYNQKTQRINYKVRIFS